MTNAIFYAGIVWLAYVYAGYPFILALLAWWTRGVARTMPIAHGLAGRDALPANPCPGEQLRAVSVLIAARNEERDIHWKIAETLAWDYPHDKLEVLVASDASDDHTDEIVSEFHAPRLTLLRMERRGGKVRALNRLAEIARGEILFFTDANAHIGPDVLRLLVRHFADARVGCVTGNSRPLAEGEAPAVASTAGLYRRYESMLRRLESALGSVLNCDGAIFCMRSALYQRLSPELANDLETPMRLGAAGWKIVYEPEALVLERDTSSPLEELKRQRRMCAQGMAAMFVLRGTFGGLRGWQFVSHKLLRWLSLLPMAAVLGSSAILARDSALSTVALTLQAIFYAMAVTGLVMAAAGLKIPRIISVPFYVMLGLVAAQIGVIDALRGRRFDLWESPTMSRGAGVEMPVADSSFLPLARSFAGEGRREGPDYHNHDSAAIQRTEVDLAISSDTRRYPPKGRLKVELVNRREGWDRYVESVSPDSLHHRWVWREIIGESLGHRAFYLTAVEDGEIAGVLPLVQICSRLFGNFLVSIPFFSYGGVLADTPEARDALLAGAADLGRQLGVRHIELRQRDPNLGVEQAGVTVPPAWARHPRKVTMELELPAGAEQYWKRLSSGMRNKIRQAQKHDLRTEWGGLEALPVFYSIFAANMRNLGTPVYSCRFFESQLRRLPDRTRILTIWDGYTPVAAAFLTSHNDKLELPWSASLAEMRKKYSHVLLYWAFIQKAIEEGFRRIDLGRCSPGSGTYEFKRHWNPVERPLYWYYWVAPGASIRWLSADNPKFRLVTQVWKHLPLAVANSLGPRLVRSIP